MLKVLGLCAGYGPIPVLDGVEFSVDGGTAAAVLGPNGVGKTTLLRTLMGLVTATAGTIILNGRDITADPPHARARAGLGSALQGQSVFPRMTVREQLRYAMAAKNRRPGFPSDLLNRLPVLAPLLDRSGDALSGGERQLVALASCLCTRPEVLLLDEPTEGLQPGLVDRILELLLAAKRQDRLTILLAEQNLEFAASLCDRIFVMRRGAIAAVAEPDALRAAEREPDLPAAGTS